MNYRLNTLVLSTEFDRPIEPVPVPGTADRGHTSALWMLDGATRAPKRLARLVRPVGLLGLKVAHPGTGLRVTVTLIIDDFSTRIWNRVHSPNPDEPLLEDEYRQHRLIEIGAQGRPRAVALLCLRRSDRGGVRQQVEFDIPAEEVGESGLLMFSFEEPDRIPDWAQVGLLENGLVGACVASVQVSPISQGIVEPRLSTGRPRRKGAHISPALPGFFTINALGGGRPVTVQLTRRTRSASEAPRGRRAKLKAPIKTLRSWSGRTPARGLEHEAEVEVIGSDATTLLDSTLPPDAEGRYTFTLPADWGTAYVRARVGGPVRGWAQDGWLVQITEATRT